MKNNKKILIGIVVLISLLIILPFFIPVKTYLNQAEKLISDELRVPVSISAGRMTIFPSPRLVLSHINVGNGEEIKVDHIVIIPSLNTLFSETKAFNVKVGKLTLKHTALEMLPIMMSANSEGSTDTYKVHIQQVMVKELLLDWPVAKLPIFSLELNLTPDNKVAMAKLSALDDSLHAHMVPEEEGHLIAVKARRWTMPVGLPLLVDSADFDMHLKSDRLVIPHIEAAMYGGKLVADLNLAWNKNWRLSGNVKLDQIAVREPSKLISRAVYLSGHLSGNGRLSATAKEANGLADRLNTDFKFKVDNGVLHGLDLIKVASLLTKQDVGGETAFDELSGKLNAKGKQYHLTNLNIVSGYLSGSGQVKINASQELDGSGEVELKRSVGLVSIPLDVSGTLDKPVVLPSKAAVAGAIAGTALMGPGLGTSLGIKAGTALNRIKESFSSQNR